MIQLFTIQYLTEISHRFSTIRDTQIRPFIIASIKNRNLKIRLTHCKTYFSDASFIEDSNLEQFVVSVDDFKTWLSDVNRGVPLTLIKSKHEYPIWLKNALASSWCIIPDIEPNDTPIRQQLVDENEALKAKVAELEQRLNEYKELPTQTKNMVMPVIYGLCCLYGNRGNPLSKSRASCGVIAKELTAKFGAKITDETLEGYYKQGRDILGKEK
jgi:hypothetical protein